VVRLIFCIVFLSLNGIALLAPAASLTPIPQCYTPPSNTSTAIQPDLTQDKFFINEILLNPHSTWNCSASNNSTAQSEAWVEIFNPQNQDFNLNTVHASLDGGDGTNAFRFPQNSIIPAKGFLVVFPQASYFFNNTSQSTIRLIMVDPLATQGNTLTIVDEVSLSPLNSDISYARSPDGTGGWQITSTPTIGATNIITSPTTSSTSSSNIIHTPTLTHTPRPSHTPSPTHTPRPTRTSTPTQNSVSISNNTGSNIGSSIYGGSSISTTGTDNSSSAASAAQPAWPGLQLPGDDTTPTTSNDQGSHFVSVLPVSQTADNGDISSKLLYTGAAIGLTLALYICWRRYMKKKSL
jgi:hypothetical protein